MGQYCRPDSERKTTSGTAQSGEPCGSNTECANSQLFIFMLPLSTAFIYVLDKCVDAPTSSTAYPGKICALTSNGGKCSSAYACEVRCRSIYEQNAILTECSLVCAPTPYVHPVMGGYHLLKRPRRHQKEVMLAVVEGPKQLPRLQLLRVQAYPYL